MNATIITSYPVSGNSRSILANKSVRLLAAVFILFTTAINTNAQTGLTADGDIHLVSYPGKQVTDYVIPVEATGSTIYFRVEGADGSQSDYDSQNSYYGGKGATIEAEFNIGNGANEIPVGSTIRMIIGEKGNLNSYAGGGGTGLAFRHPSTGQWTILMVAGGGGGSTTSNTLNQGRPGTDNTAGTHGRGLSTGENNGTNGEDGKSSDDWARPGRGYLNSMSNGVPVGSNGPKGSTSSTWGFGGGGSRRKNTFNEAGGGGGGYSGGGGGRLQGSGAGGGGGSYVNGTYAVSDTKIVNEGAATNPNNGFVEYRIDCRLARNNEAEITDITFESCDNSFDSYVMTIETDILTSVCNGLTYLVYFGENTLYNDAPTTLGRRGGVYTVGLAYDGELIDQMAFTIPKFDWLEEVDFTSTIDGSLTISAKDLVDIEIPSPEFKFVFLNAEGTSTAGNSKTLNIGSYTEKIGLITPGGVITCQQEVTVNIIDGVPPVFQSDCVANVYVNLSQTLKLEYFDNLIVTDNVTESEDLEISWNTDETRYDCDDVGLVFQQTIYAEDEQGNSSSCEATIHVYDSIPASIVCQDVTIDLSDEGTASINHLDFIVSANDNCLSEAEIISSYSWDTNLLPSTVNCAHIGQHDIELAGSTDINGNVLPKCSGTLTVRDVSAPTIVCRDTIIYIDQDNSAFTVETLPIESVSDVCYSPDELSYTWKKTTSFTCANLGSDENFWIEVKDPYDNTSSCTFTLTVLDTTALGVTCRGMTVNLLPSTDFSYTLRPTDIYNGLTSVCNSLLDHPGTLSFPEDFDPLLDCEEAGTSQTVTLIYTPDDGSPAASCTSTINVLEEFRPKITCPTGIIELQGTYEDCGALYEYEYTAWDDECPEEVEVSIIEGLPSGSIFPIGWNDMVIRVWDKSGNTAACSFVVRVAPPSARPTLKCPENYTITLAEEACNTIIDTTAIFDQTCVVQNRQYLGPTMGSTFELGSYTFGFSTRNTETNLSSSCTFTVSVDKDNKKPVAICKDSTVVLTNGQVEINPAAFDGGSYDNCYTLNQWTLFEGPFANRIFNCSDLGEKDFKLRVYNSKGAWSECDTRITFVLEDLECQDITVALDETGTAIIAPEDLFVSDGACINQYSIQIDQTTFDCSGLGDNLVILTRTAPDDTQQCTANVSVTVAENDITPPVALCIPDTTVYVGHDWTSSLDPATIDAGSYDITGCEVNDNISLQLSDDLFFCADLGPYEYFLTVSDANGNQSTCSTVITMADTLGPEIIHCRDISIELDAGGSYSLIISDIEEAFQTREVCLSAPNDYSQVQFDFDCTDLGQTIPMTIIGRDYHGNTSECDFSVTVNAAAAPTAVCQDITIELSGGSYSNELLASLIDGGSSGICGLELSAAQTSFDCSHVGDNTVTLTVTNEIGNTSNCQATVTVLDEEAPSAICQNITIQLDENGLASTTVAAINNGSSDDCGLASLSLDRAAFSCEHVGANIITLSVTDYSGNTTDCQATVTVQDPMAPIALCNDITVDLDEDGQAAITASQIDNGTNDACGITTLEIDKTDFSCEDVGTHTVILTATDENGNTASCQATITVVDEVAPVVICQGTSIQLNENGLATITVSDINNGSNDACGLANLSLDNTNFDCSNVGENTVTLTATDIHGNSSNCQANVIVMDEVAPIALCQDITVKLDENGQASITEADINNGSNDACGISAMSLDLTDFDCDQIGGNIVNLSVTDNNGNTSSCQATVTVVDEVAPVALCQDITLQLDENGLASITEADIDNGSNDACGISAMSLDLTDFDCDQTGGNTVSLSVTDNNGNSSSCQATITVVDEVAPVVICQGTSIQLNENGLATITVSDINNDSNDACGLANLSLDNTNFDCSNVGENTVTLTATDIHGNSSNCQANVIVMEEVAPIALCQDITVQLDENGQTSITEVDINNGSNDACGISAMSLDLTDFDCAQVGDNTVNLSVTDNNGNSSSCQATVTVVDEVAPVASCQNITVQLDENGQASITEADIDNGSNDACGISAMSLDLTDFDCDQTGGNTVSLSVTDNNGNSSSCQATVTVVDEVAPVASCQNITVQLDENGLASITEAAIDNGSNDACGVANISLDQTSFNCEQVGDNTVSLSITDNNGNTSSCQATVTVQDPVAAVANCQDITIELDENGLASITEADIDNGSSDACGIANMSLDQTSFDCEQTGDNTVTLSLMDNNGNASNCQATVTIVDAIRPTISCPQDMVVNTDPGECGAFVNLPKAAPADNCGIKNLKSRYRLLDEQGTPLGSWSSWADDQSGFFELGVYQIQWRTKDNSNNKRFCSFTLNVIDEEAPEVICKDLTINFNGEETLTIASSAIFDEVASFDACGAVTFVSQSVEAGSCDQVGQTLSVQVIGVDPNGNTNSCTAQVAIVGMPCGFEATDIDCEQGAAAAYDPTEEVFTLSADDCSGYPQGEFSFVGTDLCGDGEIRVRVTGLVGEGRAGVVMMESTDPGARRVSMLKSQTRQVTTEYRLDSQGALIQKHKNRSGVTWVRIVRLGNRFNTYTSTNGSNWRLARAIYYTNIADCIHAGIMVYSRRSSDPVTATFDQLSVTAYGNTALAASPNGPSTALGEATELARKNDFQRTDLMLEAAPNPFSDQTQITFDLARAADITLEVYNLHGQRVQGLENAHLDAGTHRYQWDGNSDKGKSLPSGIYVLRLSVDKKRITTKVSLVNR